MRRSNARSNSNIPIVTFCYVTSDFAILPLPSFPTVIFRTVICSRTYAREHNLSLRLQSNGKQRKSLRRQLAIDSYLESVIEGMHSHSFSLVALKPPEVPLPRGNPALPSPSRRRRVTTISSLRLFRTPLVFAAVAFLGHLHVRFPFHSVRTKRTEDP